jgi:hypothetical protein
MEGTSGVTQIVATPRKYCDKIPIVTALPIGEPPVADPPLSAPAPPPPPPLPPPLPAAAAAEAAEAAVAVAVAAQARKPARSGRGSST